MRPRAQGSVPRFGSKKAGHPVNPFSPVLAVGRAIKPNTGKRKALWFVLIGSVAGYFGVKRFLEEPPVPTPTNTGKPPTGTADKDTPSKSTDAKPGSTTTRSTVTHADPDENSDNDDEPAQPGPVAALVGLGNRATMSPPSNVTRPRPAPTSNGTSIHTSNQPASTGFETPISDARLSKAAQSGPESTDGTPDTTEAAKASTGSRS